MEAKQFIKKTSFDINEDILIRKFKEYFGEYYIKKETKTLSFDLKEKENLLPWYNSVGTEFLMITDGCAKINGTLATKGDIVRIDVGDITTVETEIGCSILSHIFPYTKELAHKEFVKNKEITTSKPLISIIIIGKNIENYVGHSILSCINQTHTNLQIIVVDDASTDTTLQKALNISTYDQRVEVYSKSLGMNGVRKLGLDKVRGDYCLIIDGDDWIRNDAIERLLDTAMETGSEYISFGFDHYNDKNRHIYDPLYPSENITNKYSKMFDESDISSTFTTSYLQHTVWSRFFSTRLKNIVKESLNDIHLYEDITMWVTLMYHAHNPITLNYLLYHYRRERNDQSTANWGLVNTGMKRLGLKSAVSHALSLMKNEKVFFKLIFFYKALHIYNYERAVSDRNGDYISVKGWDALWQELVQMFPRSLETHIQDMKTKQEFQKHFLNS